MKIFPFSWCSEVDLLSSKRQPSLPSICTEFVIPPKNITMKPRVPFSYDANAANPIIIRIGNAVNTNIDILMLMF